MENNKEISPMQELINEMESLSKRVDQRSPHHTIYQSFAKYATELLEKEKAYHASQLAKEHLWVQVSCLPVEGKRVLLLTDFGCMEVGYLLNGEWERNWAGDTFKESGYTITHWSNLPPKP